jgi:TolB protein
MSQDQTSGPRKKALSTPLMLSCGCIAIVLCLMVGLTGYKLAVTWIVTADSDYVPAWSPDGKQIAFYSQRDSAGDIYLMQSDGTNVIRLTGGFFSSGKNSDPAWSPDGKQLTFVSNRNGHDEIYVMNSDGSQVRELTDSRAEGKERSDNPDWSPDGHSILFTVQDGSTVYDARLPAPKVDIYMINVDGTDFTRLTYLEGYAIEPKWSPDGSKIAFIYRPYSTGDLHIYVIDADGTDIVQLTKGSAIEFDLDWSPDGNRIVFTSGDIYHHNIYVMNADGTDIEKLTDGSGFGDDAPCWSPDGHRIAFVSQHPDTRLNHIFIMNDDGSNPIQLTGK